jgi:hypothetical protein
MKQTVRHALGVVAVTLSAVTAAIACPVCSTELGQQVRTGIFGPDFWSNLLAVLAPLPVLAAVVFGIHRHFSNEAPGEEPESVPEPPADAAETYARKEIQA